MSAQRDPSSDWTRLVGAVRRQLELEAMYDFTEIPYDADRVKERKQELARAAEAARSERPAGGLAELAAEAELCQQCDLGKSRTHFVFGEGDPDADLMFVGEAPGEQEDLQGRPFVGRAGQLLTRIIEAIGLTREEVYIANVLKCRPPGNRNPLPDEVAVCMPWLLRQIELIRPRIIVTLGNPATQNLLDTRTGITRMRGTFVKWRKGIEVMPTFHPSFLLRNPAAKRDVWTDMQSVHARMKELGLHVGDLKTGRGSA